MKSSKKVEKYQPAVIEQKWQKKWEETGLYASDLSKKNKYYVLAEFPYPSGDLHMGHWFTFAGADIFARHKRMQGHQVFFPNGFDAFGLPAENAAIKRNIHPKDWTHQNIEKMKKQFATMGGSFNYDHEVTTCEPEYYKWNQWIFIQMYKKGLAYRSKILSNWCPKDQTVLANEHVENGKCWRCGEEVVQKEVEQWFLKITQYADRLLWAEGAEQSRSIDWPESVRRGQNDWIGKSTGAAIHFVIASEFTLSEVERVAIPSRQTRQVGSSRPPVLHRSPQDDITSIKVFTTRQDTLPGATFLVLAPEHPFVRVILNSFQDLGISHFVRDDIEKYVERSSKKTELERKENKEKTGVFTGAYVINPINQEKIPVWVADYALINYGTGALFGDAHDERDTEFAKKYGIALKPTLITGDKKRDEKILSGEEVFTGYGTLVNSGEFTGLTSEEAKKKVLEKLIKEKTGEAYTVYHLHDWSVSRQRYWGTPVPMIHCPTCGIVPVLEKDLPVELPYDVDYAPKGKPPLASNEEWLSVSCPKCGSAAKRDAETLDTFVDSSWYFFRYISPHYDNGPFDKLRASQVMPVDIYFGGAEHTLGHTLYSRFFTKFFHDIGLTNLEEYAKRRVNHGIVLGPDGQKMSKSKGNVVNPDDEVKRYGADAVRVFVAFFIPYEGTGPWISERIWGPYRFLERVWQLQYKSQNSNLKTQISNEDLYQMHRTVKKVGNDIENVKFNTAIAALMEWINHLSKKEEVSKEEFKTLVLLLAPFAPHMAEELWERLGHSQIDTDPNADRHRSAKTSVYDQHESASWSVHIQPWPQYDPALLKEEEVTIVVQVNGKLRDSITINSSQLTSNSEVERIARESEKVSKQLKGKSVKKVIYIEGKIINFVTT